MRKAVADSGSKGTVDGMAVNVGNKDARAQFLDMIKSKHGRIDVLVPNAAVSTHFGDQLGISEKAYDKLWDLNVKSTFFLIKECKEMMTASGEGGNICVVSSVTA